MNILVKLARFVIYVIVVTIEYAFLFSIEVIKYIKKGLD
jgi:hypothetical protein